MTIDSRFYELLAHLYRGGSFGMYWTPNGSVHKELDGREWQEKISKWFKASKPPAVPKGWQKRFDVYFAVNPGRQMRSQHQKVHIEDVEAVNAFYAEFDAAQLERKPEILSRLESLLMPPSVIVDSGGGYHAYWWLKAPFVIGGEEDLQRVQALQYAWVDYVGGDGGAKDLARVLRVPGTYNHKPEYDKPLPVEIVSWEPDRLYGLDEVESAVAGLIEGNQQAGSTAASSGPFLSTALPENDGELIQRALAAANGDRFGRLWAGDTADYGGDHSAADQALCNMLAFWTQGDADRIDRLFRQSGLFRQKWERQDYRNKTIQDAITGTAQHYQPKGGNPMGVAFAQQLVGVQGNQSSAKKQKRRRKPAKAQATSAAGGGNGKVTYADLGRMYLAQHEHIIYTRGSWHIYEQGVWQPVHDLVLERDIWTLVENHGEDPHIHSVNNVVAWLRSRKYVPEELLDARPDYINLRNGTYSLETRALLSHHPDRLITTQLRFAHEPAATCPTWERYIETTFVDRRGNPDAQLAAFVQEAVGYSLTTDIKHHVMFLCYGEGANGKGILFHVLEKLGGNAAIPFNVNLLSREQYQLADLAGKRIALCSEADTDTVVQDGLIKALVSGDSIQVRQIRKEPFTLQPRVKLWWAMNRLPIVTDTSRGFWRRVRLIPFNADFEFRERHLRIDNLAERLDEELAGIFNWALEGLFRLERNRRFTAVQQVDDWTAKYKRESNTIEMFVEDCCDVDPGYTVQSSTLYNKYRTWSVDNGFKPMSIRSFKFELERMRFESTRRSSGVIIQGLKLHGQPNAI